MTFAGLRSSEGHVSGCSVDLADIRPSLQLPRSKIDQEISGQIEADQRKGSRGAARHGPFKFAEA